MSAIRTKYIVYNRSGTGFRNRGNEIIEELRNDSPPGTPINTRGIAGRHPFPFAFMSVVGAAEGNCLHTDLNQPDVHVGLSDTYILVVYAPSSLSDETSDKDAFIWVDAFSLDAGDFCSGPFMKVFIPPAASVYNREQTDRANRDGVVSSDTIRKLIADQSVTNDEGVNVLFYKWIQIMPTAGTLPLYRRDFILEQYASSKIWIAFYRYVSVVHVPGIENSIIREVYDYISQFINRWKIYHLKKNQSRKSVNFSLDVSEKILETFSPSQKKKIKRLIKLYPPAANKAYKQLAKVSVILKEAATILAKAKRK